MSDERIGIRAAARILGVHENTVRRLIEDGALPAYEIRPGGYRRLDRADVEGLRDRRAAQAATRDDAMHSAQDDVLIAIQDGVDVPLDKLLTLPPWRAALLADVAVRGGCLDAAVRDRVRAEAARVGGNGTLAGLGDTQHDH
jgi:excisionase family DNA binding protein